MATDEEDAVAQLTDETVELLNRLVVKSPYGALLGLELVDAAENCVRLRLPFRSELTTLVDTVHGGAISSLVDSAATASFWASSEIAPGSRGTTIGFSINFLSAARGSDLVATARVRRRGGAISTGDVTVCDGEDKEVAVALVTYKLSTT
jgi:uncharacterized protein (TIGR00369 family)